MTSPPRLRWFVAHPPRADDESYEAEAARNVRKDPVLRKI